MFATRHLGVVPWLSTYGNGWVGCLGHGDAACQLASLRVAALQGEWVSAGNSHTIAVTIDGGVFGWGWGEAEALGLPDNADGSETKIVHDGLMCMLSPRSHLHLSCVRSPLEQERGGQWAEGGARRVQMRTRRKGIGPPRVGRCLYVCRVGYARRTGCAVSCVSSWAMALSVWVGSTH